MPGTDLQVKLNYVQDEVPGKTPYYYAVPLSQGGKEATGRKEQMRLWSVPQDNPLKPEVLLSSQIMNQIPVQTSQKPKKHIKNLKFHHPGMKTV